MKTKIFLSVFSLLINGMIYINAQSFSPFIQKCGGVTNRSISSTQFTRMDCNPSFFYDNTVDKYKKYIPDDNTPVKIIRLRFVLFHYSVTEPRNFQANNPEHIQYFKDIITNLNNTYANLVQTTESDCNYENCTGYCGINCIPKGTLNIPSHSKIQFGLDSEDIVEIVNPNVWNADPYMKKYSEQYILDGIFDVSHDADSIIEDMIKNQTLKNNAINVYFTGSECSYKKRVLLLPNDTCRMPNWVKNSTACASLPSFDLSDITSTLLGDIFNKYTAMHNGYYCNTYPECCPVCPGWWKDVRGLVHEIGHTLGLGDCSNQCDVSIMNQSGATSRNYFYDLQLGQIHKMLSLANIRQYVKDCPYSTVPTIITNNETWDFDIRFYRDIIVNSGATLTLTCHLEMPSQAKIIIMPGGKLILDGGTITSACGGSWRGIEVWGNSDKSQTPYRQNNKLLQYQGIVELKNGAIIENADEAICAIKKPTDKFHDYDWSKTGGIIRANNAIFRNNKNGVWLGGYHNFKPANNAPLINNSYIHNCTFEITDAYNTNIGMPYEFIGLYEVEGISIKGNTFQNTNTTMDRFSKGRGIMSYDASFITDEYCTSYSYFPPPKHCVSSKPNTFKNLLQAIYAQNINTTKTAIINNNIFENNIYGIILSSVHYASILSNKLIISPDVSNIVGIYLDGCTGYRVEENTINNGVYGIIVNNSGKSNNLIYKNNFTDNLISAQAQGYNGFNGPSKRGGEEWEWERGLVFKCNHYGSVSADLAVTSGEIKYTQGYCSSDITTPAGNTFSDNATYHLFTNPDAEDFIYCGHKNLMPDKNRCSPGINLSFACSVPCSDLSKCCPSKISTGGGDNPNTARMITSINADTKVMNNLAARIDNNKTQTLLDKIANPSISISALKSALLEPGPYLSDTVLISVAKRAKPMPAENIKEVMITNSSLSDRVMDTVNRINLPADIKQQIQKVQTGTSARLILEQQMSVLQNRITETENNLIRYYLSDTTGKTLAGGIGGVKMYLLERLNPDNRKRLVNVYFTQQDYKSAQAMLKTIKQETADDKSFVKFYTLLSDVYASKRNLYQLSSAEKQKIVDVSLTKTPTAKNAEALLSLVYGN
ncbi:MAG: NosD domain-containing protein, partial [Bacteroidota bacterium]